MTSARLITCEPWRLYFLEDQMSLLNLVQQHIAPDDVQNISQQLGADPATTQRAIEAALPMMVGGMAHTAQQPGGESALQGALGIANTAPALGGLGGALGGLLGGASGSGGLSDILGGILGQHQGTVQDGVQQASGLDAGKAGKLLILLAPFVLRALAKHQQSPSAQQNGGLAGGLQQEAQNAMASAHPSIGGILGRMLGGATG